MLQYLWNIAASPPSLNSWFANTRASQCRSEIGTIGCSAADWVSLYLKEACALGSHRVGSIDFLRTIALTPDIARDAADDHQDGHTSGAQTPFPLLMRADRQARSAIMRGIGQSPMHGCSFEHETPMDRTSTKHVERDSFNAHRRPE